MSAFRNKTPTSAPKSVKPSESKQETVYKEVVIRAQPPITHSFRSAPLYQTRHIVNLAALQRRLHRSDDLVKHELASILALWSMEDLPKTIVVEWPEENAIQTNYAIIGGIIFLNYLLSDNWEEGREGEQVHQTLTQALGDLWRASKPAL